MTTKSVPSALAVLALGAWAAPAVAYADRAEPVPIYGNYDAFLDHSLQTFNGNPDTSDPATQKASFTTNCDANGCVAHWLRLTDLEENPNAPALFDYTWNIDKWESSSDYPFHCSGGGTVPSVRADWLKPLADGSFVGERSFTVAAPGCPGDGPGTYSLPFTLTPTG
jgi:hypothetical protein